MPKKITLTAVAACMLLSQQLHAEEIGIGEIYVEAEPILMPVKSVGDSIYTGDGVTRKGMELLGEKGKSSVYETVSMIPGVSVEAADPYGLSAEQKNMRVRGVRGYLSSMTVSGVPNYGGNPMGPRDYIYDLENMETVSLYKGPTPANLGTGVGNRGGAIELEPLWAQKDRKAVLSQSIGSFEYLRSFVRLDSGEIPSTQTRLSASYSNSQMDNWKGPGDTGPRQNANLTAVQPIGDRFQIKMWANYNDTDQDNYRPLTYAETRLLNRNRSLDYLSHLTGDLARDINYFKYNTSSFTNKDIFWIGEFRPTEAITATIKPYFSQEDATIWSGVSGAKPMVQQRIRDIERRGMIADLTYDIKTFSASIGWLGELSKWDLTSQNYSLTKNGLQYAGYGALLRGGADDNEVESPYIKIAGKMGDFDMQVGLKYFYYKEPYQVGYVSDKTNPYKLIRAADLDRTSTDYDIWLPTAGIAYNHSKELQFSARYGKNFIRPYAYMPLVSLYNSNRAVFQKQGIDLNDLFDGYDIETSDNIDIGMRYQGERFDISPTLFFSKHKNLLTTVYDSRVNLNYQQNIGEATGYGLEIPANVYLSEYLTFFINPTCTWLTYDDDITYMGKTLHAKDKQVVDVPRFMLKTGAIYKYGDFQFSPIFTYIGKRYGDTEHKEEVSSYWTADMKLDYIRKKVWYADELKVSLELDNIFDKKYISIINASDDSRQGTTSYYAGAPFTAMLSLSLSFK
ncbi:MAG: TonB-dependent receptor [Dissulfuribacterales bacterium]